MTTTEQNWHPISVDQLAHVQAMHPWNRDDAEYIVAHPADFLPGVVAEAEATLDRMGL